LDYHLIKKTLIADLNV